MRSLLGRFHRPMSRGLVNNMLTMNNLGDGSTMSLDFTTGVLDSRLTFTRASTATYINSSGYVTTMGAAATNDPTKARFNYDPTTLAPLGLLIEGQTANLTKFSETFTNAYWNTTANNVTAADSVATSPTGVALTASTLTEIAGTGSHHVHQLVGEFTPAASTAYTMSCFVKQPTSNAIRYVQLAFWSAGFGLTAYMNYDLQTGTVGTGGAGITEPSITQYPNGWYRITARATSVAVPGVSGFQLGFSTTSGAVRTESYTASAPLKSIQLFGAQVEAGSGASSYIPTGASQVTRNADLCYMSDISSLSYSATNGSMVYEGSFSKINSSSYPTRMGFLTAAGGDPAFEIFVNGTTIFSGIRSVSANNEINRTIATNTNYKFATSFNTASSSQVRCSLNGAAAVGSGTSAITATRTPTVFGFTRSGYDLYFPSGTIKTAKYWNTTLTDADLVSKST